MKSARKSSSRKAAAGSPVVRLEGDMTIYQAEALKQQLLATVAGSATAVQLDLERVSEIDTAGVQLLIAARQAASDQGKTLALTARSPAVAEVLELFGLAASFGEPAPAAA